MSPISTSTQDPVASGAEVSGAEAERESGARRLSALSDRPIVRPARRQGSATTQALAIELDGITAGDYLTWVRDPEPPALDRALRSVDISADPLGSRIDVDLIWDGPAPPPYHAAIRAGLPTTADVGAIQERAQRTVHPALGATACPDRPRRHRSRRSRARVS